MNMNFMSRLCSVLVLCGVCISFSEEMYLTLDDDVTVILKTNHTWKYESEGAATALIGKPVTLEDGSTIILNKNRTWGSVNGSEPVDRIQSTKLESLNAAGIAKRGDLSEAGTAAMETAMSQLVKQLYESSPEAATAGMQTVSECLQSQEYDNETSHSYENKMYNVTVRLTIDEIAINRTLDCIKTRMKSGKDK
jgi:hypothetical protein